MFSGIFYPWYTVIGTIVVIDSDFRCDPGVTFKKWSISDKRNDVGRVGSDRSKLSYQVHGAYRVVSHRVPGPGAAAVCTIRLSSDVGLLGRPKQVFYFRVPWYWYYLRHKTECGLLTCDHLKYRGRLKVVPSMTQRHMQKCGNIFWGVLKITSVHLYF